MPSPYRTITCRVCGAEHQTRSLNARTCSKRCSAILRQTYSPNGRALREYPPDVVTEVCGLYLSGKTIAEIRPLFKGYRVQTILERHLAERRPAIKREQRGQANTGWKGDDAGYQAMHLRLGRAASHRCIDCGLPAADWSYAHGCPDEIVQPGRPPYCPHPTHYEPRCRVCHKAYDRKEVMPNV